ncbi:MAG: hypothetical protein OQJ98_02735 [Candidatus Pacebacteria bacterium]|nr:hypothetical protein [Candidatus Paceibacterota bacterium]
MDVLDKLFGSTARVRILRLFLFNEGDSFENADITKRTRVAAATARKEVAMMEKIDLIKRCTFSTEVIRGSGKNKKTTKKKVHGWTLNPKFEYLSALRNFLLIVAPIKENELIQKLSTAGRCKLVVVAGAFIQNPDGEIDLLVVGDRLDETKLERAVRDIETKMSRELRYTAFATDDFMYRTNIYDKTIRDIFDYPHQTVLNRLGGRYEGDWFSF